MNAPAARRIQGELRNTRTHTHANKQEKNTHTQIDYTERRENIGRVRTQQ